MAGFEAAVRANPNERMQRLRLLQHYFNFAPGHPDRVAHVLYCVTNLPADPLLSSPLFLVTQTQNAGGHEAVRQGWLHALDAASSRSMVVLNAVRFLNVDHPEEAQQLLTDAVGRASDDRLLATNLGFHYALNLLGLVNGSGQARTDSPATSTLLDLARASLESNRNAFVLGGAGVALPNLFPVTAAARNPNGDRAVFDLAAQLLSRARELAPDNAEFKGPMPLIADFKTFLAQHLTQPMPLRPPDSQTTPVPPSPSRIRVGGKVMGERLINKPEPAYPAAARKARVQGKVLLIAIVATDGHVQSLELESGDPLLVPAAMEAVRQFRYKPMVLGGEPVEVRTPVEVIFKLQR